MASKRAATAPRVTGVLLAEGPQVRFWVPRPRDM